MMQKWYGEAFSDAELASLSELMSTALGSTG